MVLKKKMKLLPIPSLFKAKEVIIQPWQWPSSCKHPKTLSFRGVGVGAGAGDDIFKTVNSVFFDLVDGVEETPESLLTNTSESSASFSTEWPEEEYYYGPESAEVVIRAVLQSERLFFEPGRTSSILEGENEKKEMVKEKEKEKEDPFKESLVLAMESEDPYVDFRKSMEEMVECHGLKDWECLEELLGWYLRVNGKKNHGFIVGAFVDLLLALSSSSSASPSSSSSSCSSDHHHHHHHHSTATTTSTTSFSSAASSFSSSSPPLSDNDNHDEDQDY